MEEGFLAKDIACWGTMFLACNLLDLAIWAIFLNTLFGKFLTLTNLRLEMVLAMAGGAKTFKFQRYEIIVLLWKRCRAPDQMFKIQKRYTKDQTNAIRL